MFQLFNVFRFLTVELFSHLKIISNKQLFMIKKRLVISVLKKYMASNSIIVTVLEGATMHNKATHTYTHTYGGREGWKEEGGRKERKGGRGRKRRRMFFYKEFTALY